MHVSSHPPTVSCVQNDLFLFRLSINTLESLLLCSYDDSCHGESWFIMLCHCCMHQLPPVLHTLDTQAAVIRDQSAKAEADKAARTRKFCGEAQSLCFTLGSSDTFIGTVGFFIGARIDSHWLTVVAA
jgi:hypothetical protein